MSGTHLIRIVSLAYNFLKQNKKEVMITEGEMSVILVQTLLSKSRLKIYKNGGLKISLYLMKEFNWRELRINHLELLDIHNMDDTSIALILSKKALNHNLSSDRLEQDDLLFYSKVIDLLTDKLANS